MICLNGNYDICKVYLYCVLCVDVSGSANTSDHNSVL